MIQLQALIELLTEKGLLAEQEILDRIKCLGAEVAVKRRPQRREAACLDTRELERREASPSQNSQPATEGWRSWLGSFKTCRAHGRNGRTLGIPLELECRNLARYHKEGRFLGYRNLRHQPEVF